MYARFYTKALADLGFAPAELREPFRRLFTQGMIRMGGSKMSKSKGNLVAPSQYLETVGADALRLYHLFVGPPADDVDWSTQTDEVVDGCARFLSRVWRLATRDPSAAGADRAATAEDEEIDRATHRLVARVSDEFERWSYNTAVAGCMEFANGLQRYVASPAGPRAETLDLAVDTLLLLLAPMCPHLAAEAWERRHGDHVHVQAWPVADPAKLVVTAATMVVQVNGKLRDRIEVDPGIDAAEAERLALASPKVAQHLGGAAPRKVIARPPNLVNVVV
jgi:leucyl-tRNA synthetase